MILAGNCHVFHYLDTETDCLNFYCSDVIMVLFVYSKSEYTLESVSMSGRPAVYTITREKVRAIGLKFFIQIYLVYISLEFEDGHDSSSIC